MNNIFLEGPIQTGKSTLIRECLMAHMDCVLGFSCQRVLDSSSKRSIAFRMMPASAPIEIEVSASEACELDGVFKLMLPDKSQVFDDVFNTRGVALMREALSSAAPHRLVLLDEIGGHELLSREFRKTLYELLESEIPCIGVIKQYESARRMVSKLPSDEAERLLAYNLELREFILASGEILSDEALAREKLSNFISTQKCRSCPSSRSLL